MPNSRERLIIEGFAGIQHFDMIVRPFTVLIGPQSVGKSIAAKLLYFFRTAARDLSVAAGAKKLPKAEIFLRDRFLRLLPSPSHTRGRSKISYSVGTNEITLRFGENGDKNGEWSLHLPPALRSAFAELAKELKEVTDAEATAESESQEAKASEMESKAFDKYWDAVLELFPGAGISSRFVPAGRSFYAQIERDFASYFESATIDPFVSEFAKILARQKQRRILTKKLPSGAAAKTLVEQLLGGQYEREGSEDFIRLHDSRKLPSKLWSSGQQEAHPLAFLLQRSCEGYFRPGSIFIEEPEAHLFPTSQRTMTELVALTFNAHKGSMRIFLTTHSPYLLTTLNNLLLAGQLYERGILPPSKKALGEKFIPADRVLSPASVGAFYMNQQGCRSLIDEDTGLIGSSAIDEVSGNLTEQFDALLELERT